MKIILTYMAAGTVPGSSFVLANSPAEIPLNNFRVNGARNLQQAQFFRAEAAHHFDRGNRHTIITFETTRQFADPTGAETFLLMHETQFPGRFLATFTTGRGDAAFTATRYLANAVVESLSTSMIGCTTRHSYRITGGVMSTTPN